jgi:MFS superfamily sulfate permease-like transporter
MKSTIISQVILSLGGTSLPTVLTSMLAELLPFLRTIASGIQKDLGSKHPGVLPTTMVAFAMASIIMGIVFVLLAVLRCGNLVGYFPHTVMKGVIGKCVRKTFPTEVTLARRGWHIVDSVRTRGHLSLVF